MANPMLFNSASFVAFFIAVYATYLLLPHRWQNRMLLVASLVFYAAWDWRLLGLLLTTVTVDYFVGRGLESAKGRYRRLLLLGSLTTSLGMLAFFKYYGFFVDSLAVLGSRFGLDLRWLHLDLILPIGISFYTFHTLSYVIDVYKGRAPACRSFVDFALFVTFFPQLVAGPIARARSLLPQLQAPRTITPRHISSGLFLVFVGYIEKVVIADGCAAIVDRVFAHDAAHVGLDMLIATYAFAFQILGDFMGYTDIARGVARLMGIELSLNFNLPYFATSPADFWRRWHISLSSWLRDYLYIPLGGNRHGALRTYRNLLMTMVLGGLWHGAAWTMVLWGTYHGIGLAVQRLVTRDEAEPPHRPALVRVLQIVATFNFVCLGWLIFRSQDLAQVGRFIRGILSGPAVTDATGSYAALLALLAGPLLLFQWLQYRSAQLEPFRLWSYPGRAAFVIAGGTLTAAFLVFHRSLLHIGAPFIYFQF
jgi:D-alanyl-lipoteichoic acid acyltransferase DltB (MBOAT superfamily)